MIRRSIKINKKNSLLLFGARGTGKSTLIHELFDGKRTLWIDLLKEEEEKLYRKNPEELSRRLESGRYDWVVVDEVQRLPALLNRVHLEIESKKGVRFALTGSSARKLKRGAANLLAGRARTQHLFPFTATELSDAFNLNRALRYGSLPNAWLAKTDEDRADYLRDYVSTYLKEEIIAEQIVRRLNPFKDFLEIAAQTNGQIVNYKKIADDVGVDDKTVRQFFSVLEDTLVGFSLPSYHRSVRKRQRVAPKFYLMDTGVKRAMEGSLRIPLEPGTYGYGKAFEHRVILEAWWANHYGKLDYKMSYLRTKDDAEVDLIIERPGEKDLLVEIKSSTQVKERDAGKLEQFLNDWKRPALAQIWCLVSTTQSIGRCDVVPWRQGLSDAGLK